MKQIKEVRVNDFRVPRNFLNFRKFKVALNATYRIFLTLPKLAPNYTC